ncbi:MAG: DNA/RNA non-specific endonuclease [Bdellovibrionales bacterium]|nr:DNA/RNA non-specific endonuclease [Bdellovibrionales bacterium]
MNLKKCAVSLTVVFSALSCTSIQKQALPPVSELPKPNSDVVELDHTYFQIQYSKTHRLPVLVQYTVSKADLKGSGKRRDNFHEDKKLAALEIEPVGPEDYPGKLFDRGHMAPAADFNRSQEAMDATFVMSNMVPQKASLNRIAWSRLEAKVRTWICGEEKLTIFTGPVLNDKLPRLEEEISIPERFFKVVFDETPPLKSIAFIYSQSDKGNPILDRRSTVDEVEKESGLKIQKEKTKYPLVKELEAWKSCS